MRRGVALRAAQGEGENIPTAKSGCVRSAQPGKGEAPYRRSEQNKAATKAGEGQKNRQQTTRGPGSANDPGKTGNNPKPY